MESEQWAEGHPLLWPILRPRQDSRAGPLVLYLVGNCQPAPDIGLQR